ncbi:endoribonuclease Dicer homolog 3a-like [Malus sylvestris]|uniref:endoribonuclease Dicer homolog 3a-like n=1 Tax=Malus sylvestris TaxID=3752 RepID=UPI0021ABC739|nr:endoribonuclease Dicer homolog 3a-like [Malus sylvestris]
MSSRYWQSSYTKIMKDFYHQSANRPKIFGMTESPVIRNGCELHADFQFDCTKACDLGFISLKLYELLQIFQSFEPVAKFNASFL